MSTHRPARIAYRLAIASVFAAVLSACGGGSSDSSSAVEQTAGSATDTATMASALGVSAVSAAAADAVAAANTTKIASEGGSFTVTGTQTVQFGAGTSWITKTVTGSGQCTNAFFGSDPAYGTVKSCQLVGAAVAAPTVTTVANENQGFTVTGTQTVRFGADTRWITKSVTGAGQCTIAFFGSDPAVGTLKTCQVVSQGGAATVAATPAAPTTPTTIANENQSFRVTGTQTVRFGHDTRWITKSVTGTGQCTNAYFGSDPAKGTVKTCQLMPAAASEPTGSPSAPGPTASAPAAAAPDGSTVTAWVRVANMGGTMTLNGSQLVRFGDGYKWATATVSNGATCTVGNFADPAPWTPEFCEVQVTAPAVVQTGNAPVINTALMPTASAAYTTARARTLTAYELTNVNYQPVAADVGAFRDPCSFSHMSFDDPIAFPGQPGASHLHTFMGNDLMSASSTTSSIANSGGSTCAGGTLNRTGYWMPTLVDTRTGQPLAPIDGNMYYKVGYMGVQASTIKPFPVGLRIIAGTASATAAIPSLARFSCLNANTPWQSSIPSCAAGDTLMASVTFPQCWDGVNLDSPDHKSHMAYGTGTGCPVDHPIALPEISIRFDYKIAEANSGSYLKLSSDNYSGPGGYSLHADWFGGWDVATHATFVADCLNKSMDCHDNLLGDGRILY